ncbi:MAG: ATP synthase F1 subunit gamma [Chitinophagaceae bacterium]|nr:ATP synthase F1 subunit gamma [Chitinophagaceae bacterium]
MSGQLKEVRNRIQSVQNTQQITKAMKMVSAAKLRRATERIIQMRPYANKLNELMSNIASDSGVTIQLAQERPVKNVLIVAVTSDRGLAGGFNSTTIKLAQQTIQERYAAQAQSGNVTVMPVGKKANDAFKKLPYKVIGDYALLFATLDFNHASAAAEWMMNAYKNNEYDRIEIVYSQFKNAATQLFQVERFLPVLKTASGKGKAAVNFIFEPEQDELVNHLIPKILKTQFFKVLLDSNASEHGARMTAMDKATDNAKELLKDLSIKYNRARQAAITTELTEIVSGAAALTGR